MIRTINNALSWIIEILDIGAMTLLAKRQNFIINPLWPNCAQNNQNMRKILE
jgi:hypothetical protein